jgi:hypothetical protein
MFYNFVFKPPAQTESTTNISDETAETRLHGSGNSLGSNFTKVF